MNVKLDKVIPLQVLEDNAYRVTARRIVEDKFIDVMEYNNAVYLKHVYDQAVIVVFMENKLSMSYWTLPIIVRMNSYIKML